MNRLLYVAIFTPLMILAGCSDTIEQKPDTVTSVPQENNTDDTGASDLDALRVSAEEGYAEAQFNLGEMYDSGDGVTQNYAEAMKWFRLAADQGYAEAQNNVGTMYGNGRGVQQNYTEAYTWLSIAAAGGYDTANQNLNIVAEELTPEELSQAQQRATELFEKIESGKNQ